MIEHNKKEEFAFIHGAGKFGKNSDKPMQVWKIVIDTVELKKAVEIRGMKAVLADAEESIRNAIMTTVSGV